MKEKLTSRDIQAKETREKLERTAMELIAKQGYHNVTISHICKACHVSVGTFYLYFNSKKDIIMLLNRQHNEYLGHVCELEFDKSAHEIYQTYVDKYMKHISDSGFLLSKSLMLGTLEEDISDDEAGLQLQREFFYRLLAYGRERGEFSPEAMGDDDFFDLFLVTINGILTTWFLSGGTLDIESHGRRHAGVLIKLLEQ